MSLKFKIKLTCVLFLLAIFFTFSSNVRADSIMDVRLHKIDRMLQMEYFMNNLEPPITIDKNDITVPSNVTVEQLDDYLAGSELVGLGHALYKSEAMYDINAVYLLSIVALESGWGESRLSKDKNNLTGYKAYDASPYESATTFDTKDDCILITAEMLDRLYVGNGRISLEGINEIYASDVKWAWKVNNIAERIVEEIKEMGK